MNRQNLQISSETDLTGKGAYTANDVNQLVNMAQTYLDSTGNGKGMVLYTTDSALGVPTVPNPLTAAEYNQQKRFIWIRVPFAGATDKVPSIYAWNDDATSDATLLKWLLLFPDTTTYEAQVANLFAATSQAYDLANTANDNASSALSQLSDVQGVSSSNTVAISDLSNTVNTNKAAQDATNARVESYWPVYNSQFYNAIRAVTPTIIQCTSNFAGENTPIQSTVGFNSYIFYDTHAYGRSPIIGESFPIPLFNGSYYGIDLKEVGVYDIEATLQVHFIGALNGADARCVLTLDNVPYASNATATKRYYNSEMFMVSGYDTSNIQRTERLVVRGLVVVQNSGNRWIGIFAKASVDGGFFYGKTSTLFSPAVNGTITIYKISSDITRFVTAS